MREFTENEKKLVNELINAYQPCGAVTIGDILMQFHKIQCFKKNIIPEFEKENSTIIDARSVKVQYYEYKHIDFLSTIFESLMLIDFLHHNRYIGLSRIFDPDMIGEEWKMLVPIDKDGNGMLCNINLYNNFSTDIWTLLSSYYVVTNSLRDFLTDFKTFEQRRHEEQLQEAKKQTKYSRIGMYVAIGAFIMAIGAFVVSLTK